MIVLSPICTPFFNIAKYSSAALGAAATVSFLLRFVFSNNGVFTGETTVNGVGPSTDSYPPDYSGWGSVPAASMDNVYEVRCSVTAGPALNSGDATGVWWPLSFTSPRTFGQSRSKAVDGVGSWNNTLTFDIRSATTGVILASRTATINGSIV